MLEFSYIIIIDGPDMASELPWFMASRMVILTVLARMGCKPTVRKFSYEKNHY